MKIKPHTFVVRLTPEEIRFFKIICSSEGIGLGEKIKQLVQKTIQECKTI